MLGKASYRHIIDFSYVIVFELQSSVNVVLTCTIGVIPEATDEIELVLDLAFFTSLLFCLLFCFFTDS